MTKPIISESKSATVAVERPTATIITFPAGRKAPRARVQEPRGQQSQGPGARIQALRPGQDLRPDESLAAALAKLNAALAEQRAAVAGWRAALGELKASTASIDEGLRRYRSNLQTISVSVSALNTKAKALEQWADRVAGN